MQVLRFTRRPTVIGGQRGTDDYSILLNGTNIGRVMRYIQGSPGTEHWTWSTSTDPMLGGRTGSMNDALSDLKSNVLPLIDGEWLPMAGSRYRYGLYLPISKAEEHV